MECEREICGSMMFCSRCFFGQLRRRATRVSDICVLCLAIAVGVVCEES